MRLSKKQWPRMLWRVPITSDERVGGLVSHYGMDKLAGFYSAILLWLLSLWDPEVAIGPFTGRGCARVVRMTPVLDAENVASDNATSGGPPLIAAWNGLVHVGTKKEE